MGRMTRRQLERRLTQQHTATVRREARYVARVTRALGPNVVISGSALI